jgi:hypothetical protein
MLKSTIFDVRFMGEMANSQNPNAPLQESDVEKRGLERVLGVGGRTLDQYTSRLSLRVIPCQQCKGVIPVGWQGVHSWIVCEPTVNVILLDCVSTGV